MSFNLSAKEYVEYLEKIAERIKDSKEYITKLDSETGDGDHWANINMGFENILTQKEALAQMTMPDLLKKVGMTMMSKVGGSSGILYGSAYMAASKALAGKETLDLEGLGTMYGTMLQEMMNRGKAQPGQKTMLDALAPAAEKFNELAGKGLSDKEVLEAVKQAAVDGGLATKDMPAVKGRASYREDKGVGFLDPGAITMSYQIESLCDYIIENLL